MKKYFADGPFGHQPVYVLKNLDDFREYKKLLGEEGIRRLLPNFYTIRKRFKKLCGTIVKQESYDENNNVVSTDYKVIGIEDNYAYSDWYWILQDINDPKIITYVNINDSEFYKTNICG